MSALICPPRERELDRAVTRRLYRLLKIDYKCTRRDLTHTSGENTHERDEWDSTPPVDDSSIIPTAASWGKPPSRSP